MEYSQDILSLLQSLELQRVAALEKFALIALFIFLINFVSFFKFNLNFLPVLGLSFFVLVGSFYMLNTKYQTTVERDLIPKLVKGIDPNFSYIRDKHIDLEDINSLKYFSHNIDNIDSDGTIQVDLNGKSAALSFVILESINVDTEEGEHETKRFDGAIILLDLATSYDQKYLLNAEKSKIVDFEAGDYINHEKMGLKPVKVLDDNFMLYSENGNSLLDESLIKKVLEFRANLKADSWVVFSGNHGYIFVDGIKGGFEFSLLKSLKEQYFVGNYTHLLKRVKSLI